MLARALLQSRSSSGTSSPNYTTNSASSKMHSTLAHLWRGWSLCELQPAVPLWRISHSSVMMVVCLDCCSRSVKVGQLLQLHSAVREAAQADPQTPFALECLCASGSKHMSSGQNEKALHGSGSKWPAQPRATGHTQPSSCSTSRQHEQAL